MVPVGCSPCSHLRVVVVDEDEEEDEADESADEGEEAEEEPLGGAHAVRLGVVRDLPRGHAHVVVLLAPVPEGDNSQ